MEKIIMYNSSAVLNLQTLIGSFRVSWSMWNDRPEKLEESLKNYLSMYNEIQGRYKIIFNNNKLVKKVPIKYVKQILSYLNRTIKEVEKYGLPWFVISYIDFVKERFTELMIIYKKGGWDKQ